MTGQTPDGWDIVESLLRTRGSVDHVLVSVADSFGIGIATVTPTGRVAWSDTTYELHGRPRIDEVHTVDDAAMGTTSVDGARLRAAYWLSPETATLTVDFTIPDQRGEHSLSLRNIAAGVIGFYRQEPAGSAVIIPAPARPAGPRPTPPGPTGATAPPRQLTRRYSVPAPEVVIQAPPADDQRNRRADDGAAKQESRAERALASSPDIIMVVDTETRTITMMVGDVQAQPPIVENLAAGSSLSDVKIHPDDQQELDRWWSELDTMNDDEVRHLEVRMWVQNAWAWRDVRVSQFSRDLEGLLSEVLVVVRDVHEQMEYLRLLEDSEKAWRVVFYGSPVGLAVVDANGDFSAVNDSFCAAVGRSREAVLSHDVSNILQTNVLNEEGGFLYGKELPLLRPNGIQAWIRIRTRAIDYKDAPHNLITLEDISVAKAAEDQLRYAALHNPLSGLPNRDLFSAELQQSLHRARRNQSQVAVLFIDLDGLRMINNSMGHQAGDELVKIAAERLRTAFRTSDLVAHRGGDEFLVLCDEVDGTESVQQLAERAISVLREPVLIGSDHIPISASVGAALSVMGHHTSEEIERMADLAMYQAKDIGGGAVIIHDPEGVVPLLDLVGALDRGELRVHYRPVYTLATQTVVGFDTILHWRRGDMVVPQEEITTALRDPAAKPVLLWMIAQAIQDVRACAPDHVEQLSLWLPTSRSALNQGTAKAAKEALEPYDDGPIASPVLVLTMNEGDVDRIGKPTQVQRRLSDLLNHGPIGFGISHYTPELLPMSLLRRLPATSVTLDPMVIAATLSDPEYGQFVAGIVAALNAGGVITIASAVDSPELLQQTRHLGIAAVHGDLLGKPYPLMTYSEAIRVPHPAMGHTPVSGGLPPASWQLNHSVSDHIDLRDPITETSAGPKFIGDELAKEFGLKLNDEPDSSL